MMLFYKLRPLLRSAQVEKELAALNDDFGKLKDAYDKCVHVITPDCVLLLFRASDHINVWCSVHQVGGKAPGGGGAAGGFDSGEK